MQGLVCLTRVKVWKDFYLIHFGGKRQEGVMMVVEVHTGLKDVTAWLCLPVEDQASVLIGWWQMDIF